MVEWMARYIRSEEPGAPPHPRAPVYRRLVRNTLYAVLEETFPVTREVIGGEAWNALFSAFLAEAGPRTSLYRDIPGDLVGWALEREHGYADLMHWEWLEVLAARHPADLDALPPSGDGLIHPNPTIQVGVYRRPVHKISPTETAPAAFPEPMAYLVWRRPRSDECAFHRAGLLVVRALALASAEPATPKRLAARLAEEPGGLPVETIARALEESFRELAQRDALLG